MKQITQQHLIGEIRALLADAKRDPKNLDQLVYLLARALDGGLIKYAQKCMPITSIGEGEFLLYPLRVLEMCVWTAIRFRTLGCPDDGAARLGAARAYLLVWCSQNKHRYGRAGAVYRDSLLKGTDRDRDWLIGGPGRGVDGWPIASWTTRPPGLTAWAMDEPRENIVETYDESRLSHVVRLFAPSGLYDGEFAEQTTLFGGGAS